MSRWWIAEPRLLGSSNPSTTDLEQLSDEGFTLLVSLLDETEQAPNYDLGVAAELGFERHNIPVRDFQPPTVDQLRTFVRLIDDSDPARAIVHCLGGSGRTGTFAAAYWIAHGMEAKEAVAHVRRVKPTAVETQEQLMVLSEFERRTDP